jgi:PAS domain S-box-containing protein
MYGQKDGVEMTTSIFLQELLDRTADGAYVVDDNQRIVAWNQVAANMLGFEPQDVIGAHCYQVLGGHADGGCVICKRGCQPYTAGRRGDLVPNFDVQVRTGDGPPRWINVSVIALPVADAAGDASLAIVHLCRDVAGKKQAQQFAADMIARVTQFKQQGQAETAHGEQFAAPASPLTAREMQILQLLCQGADTATIATTLMIGVSTARNHIQRVLHKLGVHSRLEAVTHARQQRLVE